VLAGDEGRDPGWNCSPEAAQVVRDLPLQVPGLDAERSLIIMEPV
jgi:hypothetical protein